jgi:maltooligosyltrehalose trehalohydrolase
MKRMHCMPFGAEAGDDGVTRFRLWAPAAHRVDVEIGAEGRTTRSIALERLDDGWFEARLDAAAGSRYAYRIDGGRVVPDPASRSNPDGVHAPGAIVDPHAYAWRDAHWRGRRWTDAVVYELHVGAFTPEGTFEAAAERLEHLARIGVTFVELMPIAAFPGKRNWGYDGVLPFAPAASYGPPEALKAFVDRAHALGLAMLLDVVYNHFGPEGNYLRAYAPDFFTDRHRTPWGDAINFDGERSRTVRDFFVHNALYWLDEFHFDGLRLDAVHAIVDDSRPDIVTELCATVRRRFPPQRHVHIVLENDANTVEYLERDPGGSPRATAQWNDDVHHAAHVLVTGERAGYYADYADRPLRAFGRALAEGFVYQGERSAFRGGRPRGSPSAGLPPCAFVAFMQNHDQIGNRPFGERIATIADAAALRAATACMLLSPAPPMLFMGEEFGATTPFLFFCDFGPELAETVSRGRREEFAAFNGFGGRSVRAPIPDPNAEATFLASKLDWSESERGWSVGWLSFYSECLAVRHRHIEPRLGESMRGGAFDVERDAVLRVRWTLADGSLLRLLANLSAADVDGVSAPRGERIYGASGAAAGRLRAYEVVVTLEGAQ